MSGRLHVPLVGIAVMHFCDGGTGGVLGDERGVPGHDSFYHIKMAELLPQRGLLHQFEWLKFCYFTDEGQDFVSHHYGFHVLLAPFVALSQRLTGDTLAGAEKKIEEGKSLARRKGRPDHHLSSGGAGPGAGRGVDG